MIDDFVKDLSLHMEARYPLIFLCSQEERRALGLLEEASSSAGLPLACMRVDGDVAGLRARLQGLEDWTVVVLDDAHLRMEDPQLLRLLGDFGGGTFQEMEGTLVVVGPRFDLPMELERKAAILDVPLPAPEDLRGILDEVCADQGVLLTGEDISHLVRVGQGLELDEARRAFSKAMIGWPEDALEARRSVENDKGRALRRSAVLEHVPTPASMDEVGGLDQLKVWLDSRAAAFGNEAKVYGLPAPRGLMLMGVQGCGKSLTAKAVAGYWGLPLVRLDLSAVFGQRRPESALRDALRIAQAMSPVVLWIDEIEKGFDQGGEGPSARLLGGMVTWLQEKKEEVFVVATANKVDSVPPELPRKGRFDEIFFVDLPNRMEREEILGVHMKKRGLSLDGAALGELAKATERFTGSELEQLIISAMYAAFARGERPVDEDYRRCAREAVTLYETFEKDIKRLREWARTRARPASTDRRKIDMFKAE